MKANGEFKIEKGKPLPKQRKPKSKYPWAEMKVGDSFAAPQGDGNSIRSVASLAGIRMGLKFSVAREADGYRIWRIK